MQGNDTDCGVFICAYAKLYVTDRIPVFEQDQISELRNLIAWEILNGAIQKPQAKSRYGRAIKRRKIDEHF